MDILTHIATGVAIGTTIIVCTKGNKLKKASIIFAGALGGALPDIDAISLWSKFDSTLGKFFELQHSGSEIYSAKYWYSHHGFMHSILASLLMAFILMLAVYFITWGFRHISLSLFFVSIKKNSAILSSFLGGYITHLLCDMPTPSGSWGGINLFFPLNTYSGGWGKIWWWNNYDIFLIINVVILINLIILTIRHIAKFKLNLLSLFVSAFAIVLIVVQLNTRGFNFNYTISTSNNYQKCESKSKEIQNKILGDKLYDKMKRFDNSVPIYF